MRNFSVDIAKLRNQALLLSIPRNQSELEVNDRVVLHRKTVAPEDVLFISSAVVEGTALRESPPGPLPKEAGSSESKQQIVSISSPIAFDPPRELNVLAGSLDRVRNFLSPTNHFRRDFVLLSDEDFETIRDERLDVSRSVFRSLFSALPLDAKGDFLRRNAAELGLKSNRITHYHRPAKLLVEFLQQRLANPIAMLNAVSHLHDRILATLTERGHTFGTLAEFHLGEEADIALGACSLQTRVPAISEIFEGEDSLLKLCARELEEIEDDQGFRSWNDDIF